MKIKHTQNQILIYGKHAVLAALQNKARKCFTIYIKPNSYTELNLDKKLVNYVDDRFFNNNCPDSVHQSIAGLFSSYEQPNLYEYIENEQVTHILLLDQLSDPQNIGNIIRSAAAFNFKAIILSKDRSASESATLLKAAAGCFEYVKCFWFTNIPALLDELKKDQYWIYGLAGEAHTLLHEVDFPKKVILAVGSEGNGLRPIIKKSCDDLVKIAMLENVESLNAGTAAAISMHQLFTGMGSKID